MIALLSDTHGNVAATLRALDLLAPHGPAEYIHLGDVGSGDVIHAFAGLSVRFIVGNNDSDVGHLADAASRVGASVHETIELCTYRHRVLATHGHTRRFKQAVAAGSYDAVLFGHTHVATDDRIGTTRIINPGALYRAATYSVALLDPESLGVTFIEVPKR